MLLFTWENFIVPPAFQVYGKLIHIPTTIIGLLLVVLYGCETWSLTLREEHRLRVFKNKLLRKIFGAKKDKITGENDTLYSSPNKIRNFKSG